MSEIRFAKVMLCPYKDDSRSKRECKVVKKIGFNVSIYDTSERTDDDISKLYNHYPYPDKFTGGIINRSAKFLNWAIRLRRGNYQVISAYDVSALLIAWMSNVFKFSQRKALLIYDSHEFEYGRNTQRRKWLSWLVIRVERFLIKRCEQSIMVNETIAEAVKKLHKLKETPIVVRNISPNVVIEPEKCSLRKKELLMPSFSPNTRILMYHGVVASGRGISKILDILHQLEDVVFVILGNGKEEYLNELKSQVREKGINRKVCFYPAVSNEILWQYVGAADIGMVNIENISLSYFYSLPNKLFENIQAETPVIGSNFPELKKVINTYGLGLTCDTNSSEDLIKAIKELLNNQKLYSQCKYNATVAKKTLCWENEETILFNFYREVEKKIIIHNN